MVCTWLVDVCSTLFCAKQVNITDFILVAARRVLRRPRRPADVRFGLKKYRDWRVGWGRWKGGKLKRFWTAQGLLRHRFRPVAKLTLTRKFKSVNFKRFWTAQGLLRHRFRPVAKLTLTRKFSLSLAGEVLHGTHLHFGTPAGLVLVSLTLSGAVYMSTWLASVLSKANAVTCFCAILPGQYHVKVQVELPGSC